MNAPYITDHSPHRMGQPTQPMPLVVQILSTLAFGIFAIVAVVLSIIHFWPAGVLLALILAWRGGFAPQPSVVIDPSAIVDRVRALSPEASQRRSSNASFEAYRTDMMRRLEQEQTEFDNFLDRLRAAKDESEFDHFMDQRAYDADMEGEPDAR